MRAVGPALAAVVLFVGCGQGFSRNTAIDNFGEANPDASDEQSACVVDQLIERVGLERVEEGLTTDPVPADFEEVQFREMFRCGLEGDIEAQIVEQLQASGVAAGDAPCVAGELVGSLTDADIDVLLSGEITEEFSAKFLQAMDGCGVSTG